MSAGSELTPQITATCAARAAASSREMPLHEVAAVGEVEVVAAGLDGRLRHVVVLLLERAGGVDQQVHAEFLQQRRQARVVAVDPPARVRR